MTQFWKDTWKVFGSVEQILEKTLKNLAFLDTFPRNWRIILQTFWENSWDILKNFVEIIEKLSWNFWKISDFPEAASEKLKGNFELILEKFGRKYRINDNETFSDLVKFSKTFWRTEKFSIDLNRILKKCKCKKNLGNIYRKIAKNFRNFWEKILKKYAKFFKKFGQRFILLPNKYAVIVKNLLKIWRYF